MSVIIFVFGSNEAGIHGAGAARTAFDRYGAVVGKGVGLNGKSYAIPTKDKDLMTLPLERIKEYVEEFLNFAEKNKGKVFQVTQIGCGLAGLRKEDIATMFYNAPDNCFFDLAWKEFLRDKAKFWGTYP